MSKVPKIPKMPGPSRYVGGGYLENYMHPKEGRERVKRGLKVLDRYKDVFDTIAYRGMSGALFAPELSRVLDKHLILVRKSKKDNHAGCLVEGNKLCKNYIIVDDFINTGKTVKTIQKEIKKFAPKAKCIGVLEIRYLSSTREANTYEINCSYNTELGE